jgi:hypothetical protein
MTVYRVVSHPTDHEPGIAYGRSPLTSKRA